MFHQACDLHFNANLQWLQYWGEAAHLEVHMLGLHRLKLSLLLSYGGMQHIQLSSHAGHLSFLLLPLQCAQTLLWVVTHPCAVLPRA